MKQKPVYDPIEGLKRKVAAAGFRERDLVRYWVSNQAVPRGTLSIDEAALTSRSIVEATDRAWVSTMAALTHYLRTCKD